MKISYNILQTRKKTLQMQHFAFQKQLITYQGNSLVNPSFLQKSNNLLMKE